MTDSGKSQETSGSETKDIITLGKAVARVSHFHWFPLSLSGNTGALYGCLSVQWVVSQKNILLGNLLVNGNKSALRLGGDVTSSLKVASYKLNSQK